MVLAFAVPLAVASASAPRSLAPTASMTVSRAVHTATPLEGGDVLVVGGCESRGCELGGDAAVVAEVYDRSAGRFVSTGRLLEWRDDHVAVRLRDGRVLVAGGWGVGGVLATTELFDPGGRRFSRGPVMRSPRAGATATALRDGRVLIAGGFTGNEPTISRAEVFVPKTDVLREVGHMHRPRGAHSAALLGDGRVLLVGGLSRGRVVATTEIFNPRTNRFTRGPRMRTPRYKAAAVTLRDGRVLVIGGSADVDGRRVHATTELYDPRRGAFVPGPRLRHARYKIEGAVVLLANGDVLVAGGAAAAEALDVRAMRFEPVVGSLGATRLFLTATPLGGRMALLVGGYDLAIEPTARAWLYRQA